MKEIRELSELEVSQISGGGTLDSLNTLLGTVSSTANSLVDHADGLIDHTGGLVDHTSGVVGQITHIL